MNLSIEVMEQDSNLRKNHLVLEDVVRRRKRESWFSD
jgi:hypothetical protein